MTSTITDQFDKVKQSMSDLLQEQFTLCYRSSPYDQTWKCESGYNSVNEVDVRTAELRKQNKDVATTFFPFNKQTPSLVQQKQIQWSLMPKVVVTPKPSN